MSTTTAVQDVYGSNSNVGYFRTGFTGGSLTHVVPGWYANGAGVSNALVTATTPSSELVWIDPAYAFTTGQSYSFGPPANVDLAALLYLNPELSAYSNATTVASAGNLWTTDLTGAGSLAALPRTLPSSPAGFDARLYLASRPDVSGMNATIFAAMIAVGMTSQAVDRRGAYVATLSESVYMLSNPSPSSIGFARLTTSNLSPSNARVGDHVRLQRTAGPVGSAPGFLDGRLTSVGSPSAGAFAIIPEPSQAAVEALSFAGGSNYTLVGIKVYDAERQALVELARSGGYSDDDAVPFPGFSLDMYRSVNPDVRSFSPSDAYLDFRGRWRSGSAYRVSSVDDIVNASAPTASLADGAITVSACNATITSAQTQVQGLLGVGMACTGAEGSASGITTTNTRLAVQGDIFTTGMLLSLSDATTKAEIEPIRDALAKVDRLSGCTYLMCANPERRHTGLIAQDVAAELPEAVYVSPQGTSSIAYGNLAGLFVEAIKAITARLEVLEGEAAAMRARA